MLAPVVAHGLGQQFALVVDGVLHEGVTAVERVLAQHALAPAVDGVHRGLVHPLRGQFQLARGAGAGFRVGVIGDQAGEVIVVRDLAAKRLGGLAQAGADAFAQFGSGGLGKGDHQDLRWQQRHAGFGVAQHQAQVQRGDRPGFSGAGAGLDQADVMQRQAQRIERGGAVHAASPCVRMTLSNRARYGPSQASKPWACMSAKLAQARARQASSPRSPAAWP